MTIDEALEKIERKEETKEEVEKETVTVTSDLFVHAQEILGEFLVSKYYSNKRMETFLMTLAPYALTIQPQSKGGHYTTLSNIDKETWLNCIGTLSDGYLKKTDLVEVPETLDLNSKGSLYIPEFAAVKEILCNPKNIIINPYVLVMGMEPKYRPLVAVTVKKALDKSDLRIPNAPSYQTNLREKRNLLLSCVPPLSCLAETAKEYKVTKLKEIIKNFNQVIEEYENSWKDF